MKIYTRTGDGGETSLFGGKRVGKDNPRIDAYGTVDELNACIGMAMASCADPSLVAVLESIQKHLFIVGADLATPLGTHEKKTVRVDKPLIDLLEREIDKHDEELDPLKYFILPGGNQCAATLHFCRTVCRRAERSVFALSKIEPINKNVLIYLNRLSDFLFVIARCANARAGTKEIPWLPDKS